MNLKINFNLNDVNEFKGIIVNTIYFKGIVLDFNQSGCELFCPNKARLDILGEQLDDPSVP